jgi:hypothetical protein
LVFALAAAVSRQVGGVFADLSSPLTVFGVFSGVFIAATLVLLLVDPPVPAEVASESSANCYGRLQRCTGERPDGGDDPRKTGIRLRLRLSVPNLCEVLKMGKA